MHILHFYSTDLKILHHAIYDKKTGVVLELKFYSVNNNEILKLMYIDKDYTIEHYMNVFYGMCKFISDNLVDT